MSNKKSNRQPIPKSIRFEVFKRDKFTCHYCGRKAPDIILHIDHINPVSKGGNNDLLNLITSCRDCNLGKSNRTLADTTIIDRQRSQMELLEERREQIEMMMEWQRGLVHLDQYLFEQIAEFWAELVEGYSLTEQGIKSLKKLLRQYNPAEVMEAMRIAAKQYLQYEDDKPTEGSVSQAWSKVGGICKLKKIEQTKPYMRDLFYIRGILRKRLHYVNESLCIKLLEEAYKCGYDIKKLKDNACKVRNWTQWRQDIETFIQSAEEHNTNSALSAHEYVHKMEDDREISANIEDLQHFVKLSGTIKAPLPLSFAVGLGAGFGVRALYQIDGQTAVNKAQEDKYQKIFDICLEAEQAGQFEVIANQLNKYYPGDPTSAKWLIENFPGWCLTFENGKFSVNETAAGETRQKIEALNKFIEICDLYAQQRDYFQVVEICNDCLDPQASDIELLLDIVDRWFITIENGHFVVNFVKLTEII